MSGGSRGGWKLPMSCETYGSPIPAPSAVVIRISKSSISHVPCASPVKWIALRCSAHTPGIAAP